MSSCSSVAQHCCERPCIRHLVRGNRIDCTAVEERVDGGTVQEILVLRGGYFITPAIEKTFSSDNRLLGLCFQSMLSMMQPVLANERLIPIMDGCDRKTVGHFSPSLKSLDARPVPA